MKDQDYNFFIKADVSKYADEWIAIVDRHVVAHGKSAKKTYDEAKKKYPKHSPLITRVPGKSTMIFMLSF